MEFYPSPHLVGPPNPGPFQQTYGIHERRQYSGFIQDSQQTSQPQIKPDPQARPSFHNLPQYGQNHTPGEVYLHHTSSSGDIPFQRVAQPVVNGHHHNGQRWHPQETIYNPTGPPAAHGSLQGHKSALNVPPGRPFTGNPADEQPHFKSEHGVPSFPHTPGSNPTSGNGSHDGRTKKAQRTPNACTSCRVLKAKCSGDPTCESCKEKNIACVYKDPPPQKTNVEDRLERIERSLQELLARKATAEQPIEEELPGNKISTRPQHQNAPRTSVAEPIQQSGSQKVEKHAEDNTLPSSKLAISSSHRTAPSGILSWKSLRKIVGDVVYDEETAGTVSRLLNLYIKIVHPVFPILSLAQLEILRRDFLRTEISNTTPEPQSSGPAGLKRKRSASESPQSSIERALFLLILALAKKFDDAPPTDGEGLPRGSAVFQNGYPSPENVEKPWMGACLDQNPLFEPGLKYFAAATDIMARHTNGSSLYHVQAYLLASIYHGQRAQDSQRGTYLLEAAHALQVFLQHKSQQFEISGWDNAVRIAFWTQRLLESESVAELERSESNLHIWEPHVPMPDVHQAEEGLVNNEQLCAFVAQLELRKHLNTVYTELDQQGCQEKVDIAGLDFALSNLQSTIIKLNRRLWDIYKVYQPDEARSKSPLAIRVKAKFVAAMAFTVRHYLMMILDREDQEFKMSAKVSHFVKYCITLLEQSAMASNSIKDDRLLTHAQCGDVIILLVAFSNATVKHLITSKSLGDLVNQALDSLRAWPPSALEQKYVKNLEATAAQAGLLESRRGYH